MLENIVAIELAKHYRNIEQDGVFYYRKGVEVDFYVPDKELAVQVSYTIRDLDTRERETAALVSFSKAFPLRKAVIITMDEEEAIEANGLQIEVIPIWKWLLRDSLHT